MAANDEMKQFEDEQERKWSNWERIQRNMAAREAQRVKPKSGYEPPQKPKFKDTGKWKESYAKHSVKQQDEINAKYKEKKKAEKKKRDATESKMREKVQNKTEIQRLHSKAKMGHGLSKAPPKSSNYAVNYRKEQAKMQQRIDEKYAKQKNNEKRENNAKKGKKRTKKKYDDKNSLDESKSDIDSENVEAKVSDNETGAAKDAKTPKKGKKVMSDAERAEKKRIGLIVIGPNDTPFTAIEKNEFDKLKRYAMSYKAQLNVKDKLKNTVLHHCARQGKHEMIEFLLKNVSKTIINTQNFQGNTALMESIQHTCDAQGIYRPNSALNRNKFKCFEKLINVSNKSKKTDLNLCNMTGYNALTYATLHKDSKVLQMLLAQDPLPDFEIETRQKKTALSIAVEYFKEQNDKRYEEIALQLLQAGASFKNRNNKGQTIEDLASGKVAKFIRDKQYQIALKGLTNCDLVKSTEFLMELIVVIADYVA